MSLVPTLWTHGERERFRRIATDIAEATMADPDVTVDEGCALLARRFRQALGKGEHGQDAITSSLIGYAIADAVERAAAKRGQA